MRRRHLLAVAALLPAVAVPVARAADPLPDPSNANECSTWFAEHGDGGSLPADAGRGCLIAIASTHLDAEAGSSPPESALLDPQVARHDLGSEPEHRAGGDEAVRDGYRAADDVAALTDREWTVDADVAFVAYAVQIAPDGEPTSFRAARLTIRRGVIWEILDTPAASPSTSGGGGTTPLNQAAVVGPTAEPNDMSAPDHDDPTYCTNWLAEHGDGSLSAAQHRRCMIAIASTYVDAEENSAPNTQVLFDPRVSKHSLGAAPNHQPGNSDEIRTEIGAITRVIRDIADRQWTVDGDQVWIVYDGYLVTSVDRPGFHVAERFTIRDGLIWELTIAPVVVTATEVR